MSWLIAAIPLVVITAAGVLTWISQRRKGGRGVPGDAPRGTPRTAGRHRAAAGDTQAPASPFLS